MLSPSDHSGYSLFLHTHTQTHIYHLFYRNQSMHIAHTLHLAMCLMASMGTGPYSRQCERTTGWYFIFSAPFKLEVRTKQPPVQCVQSFLTYGKSVWGWQ